MFPESLLKARKSAIILIFSEDAILIHAKFMFAWIAMHPALALNATSISLQNAPQPRSMPSQRPVPSN